MDLRIVSNRTKLIINGVSKIPVFLICKFAIIISLPITFIVSLGMLIMSRFYYMPFVFFIGFTLAGTYIIMKIVYLDLNPYIQMNRFSGTINMSAKVSRMFLKKELGDKVDEPKIVLEFIVKNFIDGVFAIPHRTKYSLLKYRKKYTAKTHKSVIDEIKRCGINIETEKLKSKRIDEKLAIYKFSDLFNPIKVRFLIQKRPIYKVIIERKALIEYIVLNKSVQA